jgi:hypothetical protein
VQSDNATKSYCQGRKRWVMIDTRKFGQDLPWVRVRLGRTVALYCRSSASYQIH